MVFALAGCGKTNDAGSTPPPADAGSAEATAPEAPDTPADTGGEKLKIAYFGGGMQATWLQNILKAMNELGEENGFEVINTDAEWDGDKMLSQIDTLIDQGIDGATMFLTDESLGPAVAERLNAAGVPFAFETMAVKNADGKYAAPGVLSDVIGMGRIPAEWTIEHITDLGFDPTDWSKTGLMLGTNSIFPPTDDRAVEYRRVFLEKYPDFPAANIVVNDVAADPNRPDDTEGSFNQAMANFTANPQIEKWLVYASVDDYAVGIARAIEANNLQSTAKMISCGGERAMPEWIADPSVNEYWVAELYFNALMYAEYVVEALMEMINEGKAPEDVLVDYKAPGEDYGVAMIIGTMVTPEDYEEIYVPGY
jgi:ABC-type sugar transport system substrate-binding protein